MDNWLVATCKVDYTSEEDVRRALEACLYAAKIEHKHEKYEHAVNTGTMFLSIIIRAYCMALEDGYQYAKNEYEDLNDTIESFEEQGMISSTEAAHMRGITNVPRHDYYGCIYYIEWEVSEMIEHMEAELYLFGIV